MGEASVEIQHDNSGRIWCEYGDIGPTWVSDAHPGVITGMGPLIIVRASAADEAANLESFGVEFTVTDGIAKTKALNGTWLHKLEPAHWLDGIAPNGWADDIMLGRWPD